MGDKIVNNNPLTELYQHEERIKEQEKRRMALLINATGAAKKKQYNAEDMDALYVLFAEKFHWTPSQVRALTLDEQILFFDNFLNK